MKYSMWIKIEISIKIICKINFIKIIKTNRDKIIMSKLGISNKIHIYNNLVKIHKIIIFNHKNLSLIKIIKINYFKWFHNNKSFPNNIKSHTKINNYNHCNSNNYKNNKNTINNYSSFNYNNKFNYNKFNKIISNNNNYYNKSNKNFYCYNSNNYSRFSYSNLKYNNIRISNKISKTI